MTAVATTSTEKGNKTFQTVTIIKLENRMDIRNITDLGQLTCLYLPSESTKYLWIAFSELDKSHASIKKKAGCLKTMDSLVRRRSLTDETDIVLNLKLDGTS